MATQVMIGASIPAVCSPAPHILRKRSAPSTMYACPTTTEMASFQHNNKRQRTVTPTQKSVRIDESHNTTRVMDANTSTASDCWFSVDELEYIRHREAYVIHNHRCHSYYLQQVTCLLGLACDKDDTQSSATADEANHAIGVVCHSEARGLEKEALTVVRQRRKQVVQTFLKSQASLSAWRDGCQKFSPDFQARALAEHYQKLARPAGKLARLIAQGDAQVVYYGN